MWLWVKEGKKDLSEGTAQVVSRQYVFYTKIVQGMILHELYTARGGDNLLRRVVPQRGTNKLETLIPNLKVVTDKLRNRNWTENPRHPQTGREGEVFFLGREGRP